MMQQTESSIWLRDAWVAESPLSAVKASLEIAHGRIVSVEGGSVTARNSVNLDGYLLLPGLINAHDHLEFNLFPRLGRGPYSNSQEWARDIYHPESSPLLEHLSVPRSVRLWWGGIKNLLSGVTTVCHHNPWDPVFDREFPVRVVRRYGWAHSLPFEKDVAGRFLSTDADAPFVLHLGEGTDEDAAEEIFVLDRIGALNDRTVLVHGVGLSEAGHALRRKRGAALVWCPTSNRFMLGSTLNARAQGGFEPVALGSDSALTARGNLLDEIRAAHENEQATAESIYRMVTESAAAILRLRDGEGFIRAGSIADLIAVPWNRKTPSEALAGMDMAQVEMALLAGGLQLGSIEMVKRWPAPQSSGLEAISVDGVTRLVRAPIRPLMAETGRCLTGGVWLAGRRVEL